METTEKIETKDVKKLWQLLHVATDDFEAATKDPEVEINMDHWVSRDYTCNGRCKVCLAGSLLYNSFRQTTMTRLNKWKSLFATDIDEDEQIGEFKLVEAIHWLNNVRVGDLDFYSDDSGEELQDFPFTTDMRQAAFEIAKFSTYKNWAEMIVHLRKLVKLLKEADL